MLVLGQPQAKNMKPYVGGGGALTKAKKDWSVAPEQALGADFKPQYRHPHKDVLDDIILWDHRGTCEASLTLLDLTLAPKSPDASEEPEISKLQSFPWL
jgi:hypothetical protein